MLLQNAPEMTQYFGATHVCAPSVASGWLSGLCVCLRLSISVLSLCVFVWRDLCMCVHISLCVCVPMLVCVCVLSVGVCLKCGVMVSVSDFF